MKQTMQSLLILMLCALLFLSGCAVSSRREGETGSTKLTGNLNHAAPVVVELWHYYVGENKQALASAIAEFNQSVGLAQGVVVEAVNIGSIAELEAGITESALGVINARAMPQIFSSYPDKAMEIDGYGKLVALGPYFTEAELGAYVPDFLEDGTFDEGRLLVLPIVKSTELLYINATEWNAFAQATGWGEAALETWESLLDTARAYYEWTDAQTPDTPWDGASFMGFDSVANFIISGCKQMGVEVIHATGNTAGEAVLDEDALRRVFDLYCRGIGLGYFGSYGQFRSDDIKAGILAAYVGSSSSAAYFPTWIEMDNATTPIDFLARPYPTFEGGISYAVQQGAGMCVAQGTPAQQEGAVLFLKWFTQSSQNLRFSMTTGYLPVQEEAYASEAFGQMLTALHEGEKAQRNVAAVYEIALGQITKSNTYAARPFTGSYGVRSILQSTLIGQGNACHEAVAALMAQGADAQAIEAALDLDARFDQWLQAIREALAIQSIPYRS